MNLSYPPRKPPASADAPLKHVIEEYRHSAQVVTCVCGWQGSTASPLGIPSAWTLHVREFKTAGR
jgi:hypothetical protein